MIGKSLDQQKAIMIAIEHDGNVKPGQRCSAVFIDNEGIQREKAFYAKYCVQSGVKDSEMVKMMVDTHVPRDPYWLVSFKPDEKLAGLGVEPRYHKVDDRTGQVIPDQR